ANVTRWIDTGLPEATHFYYKVKAYNASGNSAYTPIVAATTLTAAPSDFTAVAVAPHRVVLEWRDNSNGENQFTIRRSRDGIDWTTLPALHVHRNKTSAWDTHLEPNTSLSYKIVAEYSGDLESAPAGPVTVTTPPADPAAEIEADLAYLAARVPAFGAVGFSTAPGTVTLSASRSLTIDALRDVAIDPDPPVLGTPAPAYDSGMADGCAPGEAPYLARRIRPFRFRYFRNELCYGGYHNNDLYDYAMAHGYSILYPYALRSAQDLTHQPLGTRYQSHFGLNWAVLMSELGVAEGRYDLLDGLDLPTIVYNRTGWLGENSFYGNIMADMEHPVLTLAQLRSQSWYPRDGTAAQKAAFEQRYYDGYAATHTSVMRAVHDRGYRDASIYGWSVDQRVWHGLEEIVLNPANPPEAWRLYGSNIYPSVDILNPSVYHFYWDPRNVAYTLANIDNNRAMCGWMPQRKPIRPYYWNLLHGGGSGERWWRNLPIVTEDARAMTAMALFSGVDGVVQWGSAAYDNTHIARIAHTYFETDYLMLDSGFQLAPEAGGSLKTFVRYDALYVVSRSGGTVRFQWVDKSTKTQADPIYAMAESALLPHLRIRSEPIAAAVEGLALAKPFESLLHHGQIQIDVPATNQFVTGGPIVRRVSFGRYHLLATYNPKSVYEGQSARTIELRNFDGYPNLTLRVPADGRTRLFLLEQTAGPPPAPENLTVAPLTDSRIELAWSENCLHETGFKIDRRRSGTDAWVRLAAADPLPANTTRHTDIGLLPGTKYYYKVKAVSGAGDSPYSEVAAATTLAGPPPPAEFAAYNDLAWFAGQRASNVTTYTTGQGGELVDFASGAALAATLTVAGGDAPVADQGAHPAAGTDAHAFFDGKVDGAGTIGYDTQDLVLSFGGLDPGRRYELVLYADRANVKYAGANARRHRALLGGADAFANRASPGATVETTAVPGDTTVYNAGCNSEAGYVTRFTDIAPGADGRIALSVRRDAETACYTYANAVMIRTVRTPSPENKTPPGTAWRYRAGTSEASDPARAWRAPGYDDSGWAEGPAPFGYSSDPAEGPFGTTLA
ncbi:MAG: fibronectin type III domain-containing protein, partial [Kiritimatiellae bacterium]|nr:fibronectin type III domain-containing protein [Kiritimatiellia bacterium]